MHLFLRNWSLAFLLMIGSGFFGVVKADETKYQDIYLTEERVCKACTWTLLPKGQVQLSNRLGKSSIVAAKEIIGVDEHPFGRKIMLKSLNGIGLPAKVVVPFAFKDGQDFVCKYCD